MQRSRRRHRAYHIKIFFFSSSKNHFSFVARHFTILVHIATDNFVTLHYMMPHYTQITKNKEQNETTTKNWNILSSMKSFTKITRFTFTNTFVKHSIPVSPIDTHCWVEKNGILRLSKLIHGRTQIKLIYI